MVVSYLWLKDLLIFCMGILLAYVTVYHICSWFPQRSEDRGVAGATGGCKLSSFAKVSALALWATSPAPLLFMILVYSIQIANLCKNTEIHLKTIKPGT